MWFNWKQFKFAENLVRNPKKLSSSSDSNKFNADVEDIDPSEYKDLIDNYTEKDVDELFLAYGVDLSNYDWWECLIMNKRRRNKASQTLGSLGCYSRRIFHLEFVFADILKYWLAVSKQEIVLA